MTHVVKRGLHAGSTASKIVAAVRQSPTPLNAQEIAESLGVQYGTIACQITYLKINGYIGYIEGCPRKYLPGPRS